MASDSIVQKVFEHARSRPHHVAVVSGVQKWTYSELAQRIGAAADRLQLDKVEPGNRIVLAASNTLQFVAAYLACHAVGAVAVPIEPEISDANLRYIVTSVQPSKIFVTRRFESLEGEFAFEQLATLCPDLGDTTDPLRGEPETDKLAGISSLDADTPADILFTSGTTGRPKGVVLSHRNLIAAARNINTFLGNGPSDREVVPIPLSHSFGLGRLRCNLTAGGTIILVNGFVFPKRIFNALEEWNATGFSSVPAGFAMLFRVSGDRFGKYAQQLRYIEIGSAAMERTAKHKLMQLLPDTRICMHFGLTEASRSTFVEFHDAGDHIDSIGRPSPNVQIRIGDTQGRPVEAGETGELLVSAETVLHSYWRDPVATAAAVIERDGQRWLKTGDLGCYDQGGYLHLKGRIKDVINVGGLKVSPSEVESAINRHTAVAESACVGVPDPQKISAEVVKAFLVAKAGAQSRPQAAELIAHLRQHIEPYKIPVEFVWIPELPKTKSGKLQRNRLRELEQKTAC